MKISKRTSISINIIAIILAAIIIAPFWLLVSISLSKESDITAFGYSFIPKTVVFSAYKYIFKNPKSVMDAYVVTAEFSLIKMVLSTLLMAMIAYALSRKRLKGRKAISFYLYFTMLFSGGLVPSYILNTQVFHLNDTLMVYILPGLISPWYVFMMRTFFSDLPSEIIESAYLDGAREYKIFFRIVLPLSKPCLATVALFIFLGSWNDWYTSMLYINKQSLISLQYLLQRIMNDIKLLQDTGSNMGSLVSISEIPSETVRMAMAIVVAGPALVVFPFFQKYFVQGLTVGSVKG